MVECKGRFRHGRIGRGQATAVKVWTVMSGQERFGGIRLGGLGQAGCGKLRSGGLGGIGLGTFRLGVLGRSGLAMAGNGWAHLGRVGVAWRSRTGVGEEARLAKTRFDETRRLRPVLACLRRVVYWRDGVWSGSAGRDRAGR